MTKYHFVMTKLHFVMTKFICQDKITFCCGFYNFVDGIVFCPRNGFVHHSFQFCPVGAISQIAQLRWRNVANVAMVAVGTTTLAQRRHGRRRHNYVGATSFSQRCPNVRKLRWANVFLPTICQRCRPCWKK